MLFNLDFANNTILSCFFLFVDLCFLIPAVITQIFNPIVELVIPIEIPTKEAKAEMETHAVTVEVTISYKCFYASYSLIHFNFLLQLNNFLFHLFFQPKSLIEGFFRHEYIYFLILFYNFLPIIFYFLTDSSFLNVFSYCKTLFFLIHNICFFF